MHIYSITFRGTFPMGEWNRIIKALYDRGIKYRYTDKFAPTPDDAGLPQYYSRLIYWSETEYQYDHKRVKEPWSSFEDMFKKKG